MCCVLQSASNASQQADSMSSSGGVSSGFLLCGIGLEQAEQGGALRVGGEFSSVRRAHLEDDVGPAQYIRCRTDGSACSDIVLIADPG